MSRSKKIVMLGFVFIMSAGLLFAQDAGNNAGPGANLTNPGSEYSDADRPNANYLTRFHDLDRVELLMKANLERIFVLNVIKENYKGRYSEWEKDYNEIYSRYKEAVQLYYRRDITFARVKFDANKKQIDDLYKKIAEQYRKDTEVLLNRCADVLLELTLDARSAADPNKNRKLFQNQMRIRIAYGQLDDAARSVTDNNPHVAIEHYRVAKSYAIRILEELDKSLERNKYDVDKADNLNRIFDPNKKTTAAEHEINRPRAE